MKTIKSKDNPTYKEAVRLLRKKYRDQTGMFLLEGPRPVMDAVKSGGGIDTVFVSESAAGTALADEFSCFCGGSSCGGREADVVKCVCLADELFNKLSDTEHSQGILAVAVKARPEGEMRRAVILDRLQDPGNIGTIIRTAEAAGFDALIAIKGTGDIYAPKTVRAAAGSLLRVDVFEGYEPDEAMKLCREQGLAIVASDLEGSVEYTRADLSGDLAIVIGNEGSGISPEMRQAADVKVRIPMEGNIESLNAAVAGGVLMYEAYRQKSAGGLQER